MDKYGPLHAVHTFESIDGPLFELLKRDFRSWRRVIDVQPMRIVLLLEGCGGELTFLWVNDGPPLRINSINILSDHDGGGVFFAVTIHELPSNWHRDASHTRRPRDPKRDNPSAATGQSV